MSIPLLRFPLLASVAIAKHLDIVDLMNFLQLSKRAKNLVKLSKTPIKLKVFRDTFQLEKSSDPENKMQVSFVPEYGSTQNQRKLPFKPILYQTPKNREHEIEEYKRMMNNFVEIFIVSSVSFNLKNATFNSSYCFIEYAKNAGLKLELIEIGLYSEKNKNNQRLLTLCSDASELIVEISKKKTVPFNGFDQFKMDRLSIRSPDPIRWFTVDRMCALVNCSSVSVYYVNWTGQDFNEFIQFWIGSEGKLNEIALSNRDDIDSRIIMNGINNMRILHDEFEIERANGVRARVYFATRKIVLRVNDI